MWTYIGQKRPPFAITPGVEQESVWNYPRPPKIVADHRLIVVRRGDALIADLSRPPNRGTADFYIPPSDARVELLKEFLGRSVCEWKGAAR